MKAKDESLRRQQNSAAGEMELKKRIVEMQQSLKEKDEAFENFEREGQILAKKQSDMEKNVRKSKAEVKEKVIGKLSSPFELL